VINKKTYAILVWTLFAICAFLRVIHAHASLGQGIESVEADRKAWAATAASSRNPRPVYSIEELSYGSTTVREYVSASGVVFGVAWSGRKPPALDSLLGSYAQDYASAMTERTRARGRQPLSLAHGNLVVETWGHMRKLAGHVYVPTLLPTGVSANEIR
jgi:hypothetical protein